MTEQRTHRRSFAALIALALPVVGMAESAVWRVENGGSAVFLGGTIHKLSPQQYPLPGEYQAAYERSDIIVFETDIEAMGSAAVQGRLAERSRLPDGQTLGSVLNASIHTSVQEYCDEIGFPCEHLETLQPVAAMLTLLSITMHSLGITAPGVDEHFFQRAQADSKDIRALESVEEQIDHLMSLDQGDPDRFVQHSIDDLREARRGGMEEGLQVWRQGEEAALVEHFLREQMLYSPALYQSLMVDRNRAWLTSIRQYIQTPETELVLVGVAHLVGDHGLVTLLQNEGYSVEKFLPRPRSGRLSGPSPL